MRHDTHEIKYTSSYLNSKVKFPQKIDFHQIALTWDPGRPEAGGHLFLDPNTCSLDEFGKTSACTRIAVIPVDVKLTPFKKDPEHQAYTLESSPQGGAGNCTALPLRLVTTAAPGQDPALAQLLVLRPDQSIEQIIDLHQENLA
jgi:hypothetical protein